MRQSGVGLLGQRDPEESEWISGGKGIWENQWCGYEELHGLGSHWVLRTVKVASRSGKHSKKKQLLVIYSTYYL